MNNFMAINLKLYMKWKKMIYIIYIIFFTYIILELSEKESNILILNTFYLKIISVVKISHQVQIVGYTDKFYRISRKR